MTRAPAWRASCRQATATPPPMPATPQRALAEQHAPGGEIGGEQRAGADEVGVVGQRQHAALRHHDEFGEAAVAVLAHDLRAQAQRLIAGQAIAAGAAEGVGVDDGLRAGVQPAVGIGFDDDAGRLDAQRLRQPVRDAGTVVAHVQVDAVQARRMHPQQHLTAAPHGHRHVAQHEAIASPLFEHGSFHSTDAHVDRAPVYDISKARA